MKYFASIMDNEIVSVGEAFLIGDDVLVLEISEKVFNEYCADNKTYIYKDEEIIANPNYDQDKATEREEQFKREFIQTSLGWYRKVPNGYSNAPQTWDIINNLVNTHGSLTSDITNLMWFYPEPDFFKEECTEAWLLENKYHPEEKTKQEWLALYSEFQTNWAYSVYLQ